MTSKIARVVAWSLAEAHQWLGDRRPVDAAAAPGIATRLRDAGAQAVCIVDAASAAGRSLTWLDTEHARGWLGSARDAQVIDSSGPERFASHLGAAMNKGFVAADAAVLAAMATADGWRVNDPALLPQLSWSEQARFADAVVAHPGRLDLYAIVDGVDRLQQVLATGVKTVQLRIKTPGQPAPGWHDTLRSEVRRSVEASVAAGAELFVNDHWQIAADAGAHGVHLGQEDLLALGDEGRAALQATGMALGISSHSLWELCRAGTLAPRYVACGPVWPTLTKAMPWRAQGMDNLAWWCRMAPAPVVAIGGILGTEQVEQAARCGADGICIVRGLGPQPETIVPSLQAAMRTGRAGADAPGSVPEWPHPSLASDRG